MTPNTGALASPPSAALTLAPRPQGSLEVRAVHRGTGEVQTHVARLPFAILGRAPQVGIRLDDPSVSQCHALLLTVDGVPYCLDLGSRTGVLWDDGEKGRGWIRPDQVVRIGMFDVRVLATDLAPSPGSEVDAESQEPQAAVLEVYQPTSANGCLPLDLPVTLIGRHPNCNLRFLDEAVAYFQCALVRTRQGVWCVDLLSRKGTPLNGRLARLAVLREGDLIELGKVSLVYRNGSQPPALLPASAVGRPAVGELRFAPAREANLEAAVAPLREVMEQFQQCFLMMTRMFTTMQQEHTAMMCEQMRQIQELLRETRAGQPNGQLNGQPNGHSNGQPNGHSNGSAPTPATAAPTSSVPSPFGPATPGANPAPPAARPATPKSVDPEQAKLLEDAHAWFLERLKQTGPFATNQPKLS